jgi:type VI secretion system secreted protein VgrG
MARPITVDGGGVSPGTLLFRRMVGSEELGRPFEYEVELLSPEQGIPLSDLVGQTLAVHTELAGSPQRHFHGLVTRFSQVGWSERHVVYQATLRPSLWLLTRRAGCRIFQNQSVPDIVRAVLSEYGLAFDASLSGSYPAREYVVQYRETDLDFVSRLMEHEGIYYFFRHEAGKHTLVLADSAGAHEKPGGYEEVPFYPPQRGERRERDHIQHWRAFHQMEPTAFSLRDYDFTRPRANLEVKRSGEGGGSPELEIYDFPGGYVQAGEGDRYARTRLEERVAGQQRAEGGGNVRGLGAGVLFKLIQHPRPDQNVEYLVVSAAYELAMPEQESSASPSDEPVFWCRFTALESRTPYRPPRSTPKPLVMGPQTARVVGKSGEEIWTDSYGRVKVEFHWDRASPGNEGSSCWVRVAQAWSGGAWGAMHVPRIGQEVVVEFLDGDPDRPLVTGHLHNADNMPPYALPANQTRSGFKSRSTKGGATDSANEIRFEDKKGEEQLYLQAERDYDRLVKHDATQTIGNDETHSVGHDRKKSVGHDEKVEVKGNRRESVGGNESIAIAGNRTESVGKDESVSVGGNRALQVAKSETIDVAENRSESVGKDATLTVQGNRSETVAKDVTVSVSGQRATTVAKNDALKVDKALAIDAADEIVLESGSAKLVLKKDGTIQLEGKDITIKGSGKITVKASGDVIVKGSNVKQN